MIRDYVNTILAFFSKDHSSHPHSRETTWVADAGKTRRVNIRGGVRDEDQPQPNTYTSRVTTTTTTSTATSKTSTATASTTTISPDPLSFAIVLASFIGLVPRARGLGPAGSWRDARTLASATLPVVAEVTLITVYCQEILGSPTVLGYTTVQRLAEVLYFLIAFSCPCVIVALLWHGSSSLLSLIWELRESGRGTEGREWGGFCMMVLPAVINSSFCGLWYIREFCRFNTAASLQVMFTVAFAWTQVITVLPLLLQLLLTCRLTARLEALTCNLSHTLTTLSQSTSIHLPLYHPRGTQITSNHIFHSYSTPGRLLPSSYSYSPNFSPLPEPQHSHTHLLTASKIRDIQDTAKKSPETIPGVEKRGDSGACHLQEFANEHQHLREVFNRLCDVLGPTILLSHVLLVYTVIMGIFTFVFSFKHLLNNDLALLVGIVLSCLVTPAALYLSGARADRLTDQASAHLPLLVRFHHLRQDHRSFSQEACRGEAGVVGASTGRPWVFTVCGLYTVNRGNLPAIVQAVTSYLVILLQFYFSELYKEY
ncbi:uncharacterized protein Gr43a [Procambarus clarkii]|uniref:uncharacterized protein Gr43a n=1 Tax=Procambarus clarkii TaxID=6728 RepID=UPI001E672542|nr:uncharacterized protein LOC123768705 [Procambarus clarkii]